MIFVSLPYHMYSYLSINIYISIFEGYDISTMKTKLHSSVDAIDHIRHAEFSPNFTAHLLQIFQDTSKCLHMLPKLPYLLCLLPPLPIHFRQDFLLSIICHFTFHFIHSDSLCIYMNYFKWSPACMPSP